MWKFHSLQNFSNFVLMRLELYISDLLYRYECVTIPEFGAFLTQRKGAQVHHTTNAFYPPTKELSFNAQLTSNDGLLVKYIADVTREDYESTLQKVRSEVDTWKKRLDNSEIITLENIGDLFLNVEGKMRSQSKFLLTFSPPATDCPLALSFFLSMKSLTSLTCSGFVGSNISERYCSWSRPLSKDKM